MERAILIWRVAGLGWAATLLVGLPLISGALGRRLRGEPIDRMAMYASAALSEIVLVAPTLALDLAGGKAGIHLLARRLPWPAFAVWTLGTVAACIVAWAAMLLEAKASGKTNEMVFGLLPRNSQERTAFFVASVTAGIAEEYMLRGFCFALLARSSGSVTLAYVATSLAFGFAHAYQGIRGVWRATLLGAILGIPVAATAALVPSVIAHAAINIISGRWTPEILRSLGVAAE